MLRKTRHERDLGHRSRSGESERHDECLTLVQLACRRCPGLCRSLYAQPAQRAVKTSAIPKKDVRTCRLCSMW